MARRVLFVALVALVSCGDPSETIDAALPDAPSTDDGTPTRQACTSVFGTALPTTPTFGRLDGILVSIVPPSSSSTTCNADDAHIHLQIRMNGATYDVAVDVSDAMTHVDDVHSTTLEHAMPANVPWAEGWHTSLTADYAGLGAHSTAFPLFTKADLVTELMTDLATANHVSIYSTTYGADGAHLVHRNGSSHDGLVVTKPLSTTPHLRLFSFSGQTF